MAQARSMEDVDITATNPVTAVEEDAEHKTTGIDTEVVVVEPTLILHITVGHTECVIIGVKTAGPHNMATKRTRYVVTIYQAVKETAPESLG